MLELNTCQDVQTTAQNLQLHFFSSPTRDLCSCIPPDFVSRALMLVLYLLPCMKPHNEPYVRSKLDIETQILSQESKRRWSGRFPRKLVTLCSNVTYEWLSHSFVTRKH